VDSTLTRFVGEFPPVSVYQREMDSSTWLSSASGGVPNRQLALEELMMLWLTNANPATAPVPRIVRGRRPAKTNGLSENHFAVAQILRDPTSLGPENLDADTRTAQDRRLRCPTR